MKFSVGIICLLVAALSGGANHSLAAEAVTVNLVNAVAPEVAVAATSDANGNLICANGLVVQSDSQCCPAGTDNNLRPWACTPPGITDGQLFKGPGGAPLYCPSADMYIVADRNRVWFSCADGNSTPIYPATTSAGNRFCSDHGYGFLIKINPWGTVGCVKVGDSQGDGCIEAGTCSFTGGK